MHRVLLASTVTLCAVLGTASGALASSYPDRAVTLVVPYAAGGPVDILARGLAQGLGQQWGQPVVVENKPGANEIIAAQVVARANPDGYTLLMASDPVISQNQYLYKTLPYDAENAFVPVTRVARINMALFVRSDFPAGDVAGFVQQARSQPGQLAYGSSGVGNITHLAMAWLEKTQGVELTHVPYKGLAPVIQDLLGGQVQAAFGAVSAIEPHVTAGRIKVLALSGAQRAKVLPEVPTLTELGMAEIDANLTVGLLAPAGTSLAVRERVTAGVQAVLAQPDFRERYIDSVALEAIVDTPEQFAEYIQQDRERQRQRIEASGARLE